MGWIVAGQLGAGFETEQAPGCPGMDADTGPRFDDAVTAHKRQIRPARRNHPGCRNDRCQIAVTHKPAEADQRVFVIHRPGNIMQNQLLGPGVCRSGFSQKIFGLGVDHTGHDKTVLRTMDG